MPVFDTAERAIEKGRQVPPFRYLVRIAHHIPGMFFQIDLLML